MIRKATLTGVIALGLLNTSCLGPNNAHNSIRNWNATVGDQDWVEEVIFVGFHILPVYQFAYLGDILIFNTIDYWTDNNPINAAGEFPDGDFTGK